MIDEKAAVNVRAADKRANGRNSPVPTIFAVAVLNVSSTQVPLQRR